ncbi:PLP-dependent aminotransferase family protein [Pseudoalteromonas sp. JBTF-M23]|uniref:PLP-dependent aminotransferase family protein n=1 Tax=Pseudoalteromonas caenipelagi TaxID=2726988 RepID=A0A849VLK2_9GAMM|nr:PLP-dependent aminotransferase family protein [Pseudoalteromonas caenipelagi]NOU52634.1 PLP-dependent aminotransferase family protein [Pseudoalteromonas caenipelagi]
MSILSVINGLSSNYPDAISLALGRPNPDVYNRLELNRYRELFRARLMEQYSFDHEQVIEYLLSYGPSEGLIQHQLSQLLANDENIEASADSILVTNGCQEGFNLVLLHELTSENDCVLIIEPGYFSFSNLVDILGKRGVSVPLDTLQDADGGFDFSKLESYVQDLNDSGFNPKLIYINPSFNNPMSYCLSESARLDLLEVCARTGLKIIEDSTYASFSFSQTAPASIKSLDSQGLVYYVGSFSKTLCPGLRIGYLVLDDDKAGKDGELIHLKSHTTLNTSALTQELVGGFLIEHDHSLQPWLSDIKQEYRLRRDAMLAVLAEELSGSQAHWEIPEGGFFLMIHLPFEFDLEKLEECVKEYEVACMPVKYPSLAASGEKNGIRLAYSYYSPEQIAEGTRRLCKFLKKYL